MAHLLLMTVTIVQPDTRPPAPRLERGQELVYSGSHVEESIQDEKEFRQAYRLETRVFVLDVSRQGADVAIMTAMWAGNAQEAVAPGSVRLALARVDVRGRFAWQGGGPFLPPLDRPATLEGGLFVELPATGSGPEWDVVEPARPPRGWAIDGVEVVDRVRCVRLVGDQQTADWGRPIGMAPAWRRTDIAWVGLQTGFVQRVERLISRQESGGRTAELTLRTRYDLVSQIAYPDQFAADRRREVEQAARFARQFAELRPRTGAAGYNALLNRIDRHLETPPTPYRQAVVWLRKQADAGRRGEAPAAFAAEESSTPAAIAVGQPAPDFVAIDLATGTRTRLRRLHRDRPVLLVFYRPESATAAATLRCAQAIHERLGDTAAVVVLCVTDDAATTARHRAADCPNVAILAGREAAATFAREATPRFVVLDAAGIVRHLAEGWGSETAELVEQALAACRGR